MSWVTNECTPEDFRKLGEIENHSPYKSAYSMVKH